MEEDCRSFQLISGNGDFNVEGLENFARTTDLSQRRLSYAVVAIIGPQSSGKSTLLNHLFQTNFLMMDAYEGRVQTTLGIWMAKGIGMKPFTIVLDVEGSDSKERGEAGATFEKRSALFTLAVADVIIINLWCHDIGREQAAIRPLLKTVFEAMMRLFGARKTNLLFVLRDKTKTPLERFESDLKQDLEDIWAVIAKPADHKWSSLEDFFNVEITALPNYETEEQKFKDQVARLKQRFFLSPGRFAGDRTDAQPASGFSDRAQQIWKTIKENKDLDLPALEVLVATFRCEQIVKEMLSRLTSDEDWLEIREDVKAGPVPNFKERLRSILERYLSDYDEEAMYLNESIRNDKRQELEKEALNVLHPAYVTMLQHLRLDGLKTFNTRLRKSIKQASRDVFEASIDPSVKDSMLKFDEGCKDIAISKEWDASTVRESLNCDIKLMKSKTKRKFDEAYNTVKAKTVRAVATGIGGLTGAGVATTTYIGNWNATAAKEAGAAAAKAVRRILKRYMLKLDNLDANEYIDDIVDDNTDDNADDIVDDSDNVDDSDDV